MGQRVAEFVEDYCPVHGQYCTVSIVAEWRLQSSPEYKGRLEKENSIESVSPSVFCVSESYTLSFKDLRAGISFRMVTYGLPVIQKG